MIAGTSASVDVMRRRDYSSLSAKKAKKVAGRRYRSQSSVSVKKHHKKNVKATGTCYNTLDGTQRFCKSEGGFWRTEDLTTTVKVKNHHHKKAVQKKQHPRDDSVDSFYSAKSTNSNRRLTSSALESQQPSTNLSEQLSEIMRIKEEGKTNFRTMMKENAQKVRLAITHYDD